MRKGYDSVDDLQRAQPEQLAAERDGALVRAELAQRLLPVQPLDELGGRRRGREDRARSLPEHDLGGLAAVLASAKKLLFHVAACSSGSLSIDVRIHASHPVRFTHALGRSSGRSSSMMSQLPSNVAYPPTVSRDAASCTTCAVTSSPRNPLSRYAHRASGETTNGALHVIRSNVSPSTGAKKLPLRHSTLSSPLRAAFSSVYASARSLTSVAMTCCACRAARSAWMPLPVPTSSARRTRGRGVSRSHVRAVGVYVAT